VRNEDRRRTVKVTSDSHHEGHEERVSELRGEASSFASFVIFVVKN